MKKIFVITGLLFLGWVSWGLAQGADELLLDDFEGEISGGETGTVDYGSGNGSTVEVKASREIKYHGEQALEVNFEALSGGYIWVSRGYGLTVKGAGRWLVEPKTIDFTQYNGLSFYMYGANSKNQVAVDIVDNGGEYWRYLVEDDFSGWKEVILLFKDFFARGDWQPEAADKNGELNFPVEAFQFEPTPQGKGAFYFDYVRLVKK